MRELEKHKIDRLEAELDDLRNGIIEMMSNEVAKVLTSYFQCKSHNDLRDWELRVVENIVATAEVEDPHSPIGPRGACPLCKSRSRGPYAPGFVIPGGLRLHLLGRQNAHQCPVTRAAFTKAKDRFR